MSRGPDESPPRPPKRPGPPPVEPVDAYDLAPEEPSTFRPAPVPPRERPAPKPKAPLPPPDYDESVAETFRPAPEAKPKPKPKPKPRPKPGRPAPPGESAGGKTLVERLSIGRVNAGLLAQFSRQFGTYMASGVGLTKSLDGLEKQFRGNAMGPVAGRLSKAVGRGETLTDAAARETQAFDGLFLSMLRVAEERGGVPETMKRLASHYEARQRMIRQARSAMIYPTAVILVTLGVGGLLTVFVLPKLVGLLEDVTRGRSIQLPLPTRILIALSNFIGAYGWWLIPLALAGTGFGLVYAYRTPRGKAVLDEVALRVPVSGKLLRCIDTARFSRTLSDLLLAGVPIRQSLDLTADTLHLVPYQNSVRAMKAEVRKGNELGGAILDSGRFEPDVHAFIETGEETGTLPESLGRVAREYEERVDYMVKNLGSLIQPLIVITLGTVVGFIAIAFIMAYIAVIASLAGGG